MSRALEPDGRNLFTTANTYTRPGTAYLALWQALGRDRMISAMNDIQSTYGGGNITEQQLEDSSATGCRCRARRATRGSTSSSRSGSTRRTRRAARTRRTSRRSPARA